MSFCPTDEAVTQDLALAGFKPWISFVDDIKAAFTTHDLAIAVTTFKRTE